MLSAKSTETSSLGEVKLLLNPLFFYTRINHPLVLSAGTQEAFVNADGYTNSKGMDLSFRLSLDAIKFYTGYSYTIAQNHLTGKHLFIHLHQNTSCILIWSMKQRVV